MIRPRILAAPAAALALLAAASPDAAVPPADGDPPVELLFVSAPAGNLFYQLECLAQRIRCSYDAYRDFWVSTGFDDRDQAVLDRFSAVLDLYDTRAELGAREDPSRYASPFGPEITDVGPLSSQSISLLWRIRAAAYGAADADALRSRLELLMHPGDVDEVASALVHFRPRFDRWWNAGVEASVARFAKRLEALMASRAPDFLPAAAAFYGLPADGGLTVYAHLMPHPSPSEQIRGSAIENHAVLELRLGEAPEERLGVLVHEIAHYFFAVAPAEFHGLRLEGALNAGNPRAPAAMGLMNEAFATAIGNGVLEEKLRGDGYAEYLATAQSFYASDDIDRAAKAIVTLVADYLSAGRAMDARFVDRYYTRVMERLGAGLDSLEARLRVSAYVATDDVLDETMHRATRLLDTRSVWNANLGTEDLAGAVLTRHTYLNGVALAREADREALEPLVPGIGRLRVPEGGSLVCTVPRESGALLYVVLAGDPAPVPGDLVWLLQNAEPCPP